MTKAMEFGQTAQIVTPAPVTPDNPLGLKCMICTGPHMTGNCPQVKVEEIKDEAALPLPAMAGGSCGLCIGPHTTGDHLSWLARQAGMGEDDNAPATALYVSAASGAGLPEAFTPAESRLEAARQIVASYADDLRSLDPNVDLEKAAVGIAKARIAADLRYAHDNKRGLITDFLSTTSLKELSSFIPNPN